MKRISPLAGGFTLLELLASMAILAMMMVMLFSAFNQASRAWMQGENRVETFQQARAALDFMSKELSQAIASTNVQFLANPNSLAFVAPVSSDPSDGVDLMEVVYRLSYAVQGDTIFTEDETTWPKKLVRRASAYSSSTGKNYYYKTEPGSGGASGAPWDFYTIKDWPETSDPNKTAVLAENVVSLYFEFTDVNGNITNIWNSTNNPGGGRPWEHEVLGTGPVLSGLEAGTGYMTNRAPTGVYISIDVVDSRAAKRLRLIPQGTLVWTNAMKQARQTFTTFVSVPNRQP